MFLLLRATVNGPAYVSRQVGNSGMVAWTTERARALLIETHQAASDLQEAVVTRYGIACAVVPEDPACETFRAGCQVWETDCVAAPALVPA